MSSSAPGAVSNIRAMFEAKKEQLTSSPPSRGRSPSGNSDLNSIRSTSSRPVSKIRRSFVAVEKIGEMGGPIIGLRMVSDVQDKVEDEGGSKPSITSAVDEESVVQENEKEDILEDSMTKGDTSTGSKESTANGSKSTDQNGQGLKGKAVANRQVSTVIKTSISKTQISKVVATSAAPVRKQPTTPKEVPERSKEVKKPTAISTIPAAGSLRTVTNAKPKANSTKPNTPTSATKPPSKRDALPKPTPTPRTSLAPSESKENKFVKPKPKSPTKPVRLPVGATASTTASAAKTTADRSASSGSNKPRTSTDGDFLARMMRPTAASASKTHEKTTAKVVPRKAIVSRPKPANEADKSRLPKPVASQSDAHAASTISTAKAVGDDESNSKAYEIPILSTASDKQRTAGVKNLDDKSEQTGNELEGNTNQGSIKSTSEEHQNEGSSDTQIHSVFNGLEGSPTNHVDAAKTKVESEADPHSESHQKSFQSESHSDVASPEHAHASSNKHNPEASLINLEENDNYLEPADESHRMSGNHDISELKQDTNDHEDGGNSASSDMHNTETEGAAIAERSSHDDLSEFLDELDIEDTTAPDNTDAIQQTQPSKAINALTDKSPKDGHKAPETTALSTTAHPPTHKPAVNLSESELAAKIKEEEDETW